MKFLEFCRKNLLSFVKLSLIDLVNNNKKTKTSMLLIIQKSVFQMFSWTLVCRLILQELRDFLIPPIAFITGFEF